MYYIKHISEHKIVPVKDLELAISVSDQTFYMTIYINLRQIRGVKSSRCILGNILTTMPISVATAAKFLLPLQAIVKLR